ncbi:MAG: pancreas/duodenum homeobox protein 1 [Desulfofustis sp.]|nr:pancreas/duodenum homeobox protein 1 [Desulfofustis sp.]
MSSDILSSVFSPEACRDLLPPNTADEFFDALFGDAGEGSYDISLNFRESDETVLRFDLELRERPGHCLACNLTYGLPEVFSRHPIINIKGLVEKIDARLGTRAVAGAWRLGATEQQSRSLHVIPLLIELKRIGEADQE